MADINDQYLQNLRVAIFQFARESSNFTSILTDVFNNLDSSSTKSSKQIDNSTKSVKGFGDAISSSSNYLKDFKSYVSNNSKTVAESSKIVKEYTSQLADLKQKSIDINRNWGALNSSLRSTIAATESTARQHERNVAQTTSDYFQARDDLSKARQAVKQAQQDFASAFASGNVDAIDKAADIASAAQNLLKSTRDSVTALADKTQELKKLDVGKAELNAKIAQQNQELYTNIYDTFGNSLLKIDNLINEKTSTWKGLTGSIDELAKEAFKNTSLDISKEFQKNGIPGLHDYNKALAQALLELEKSGGIINESNYYVLDNFQKFAERVGDSSDTVKNLNDKLNEHVKNVATELAAGRDTSKIQTGLAPDTVEKLTKSYEGNIDALDKFSKSINKTFTRHQIAFSTIIDKQLSEQSNIFGKFIYNFGKGAVQGGDVGSAGMERALNEFTGSMRAGLLPALKGIVENSKGFIKRETDAFADFIQLDRTNALRQQMGEEETIKLLSDTKPIWQSMEGGVGEFNRYQSDLLETSKKTLGTNVEQRQAIQKANLENLRALGLLSHTVDESANTDLLKSMMGDMQKITAGGGLSLQAQSEIMSNVMKSSALLKASAMLDKDRKRAQLEEIQNTIKFASALKMTTEQASTVATALATMNTNMTRQQMVANVGSFMQMRNIIGMMGADVGISSGISDADLAKMTKLLQTKSTRPEDQEFIRDTMFNMVANIKDTELAYRTEIDKARERGDEAAVDAYNVKLASLDDLISQNIESFSGPIKDIVQKFAESYPTSKEEYAKIDAGRKEGETFQQAMIRYVDTQAKKNIKDQDTTTNNFEKSVTDFGNYVTAFGKNIFGANAENLFTVMFNGFTSLAEVGIAARALTSIFGAGGAAAGAAGAAGAGGLGAAAAAVLPEILATLGVVGGIGMFAYGVKGLYDHVMGNDIIYKADRGQAIHGMVEVNNLDMYTNQVTEAIDAQTQELLSGFTNIMGKPVEISNPVTTNTENVQQKTNLVPETSLPFPGYKPYNPTDGTQNIPNIEQNALVSPAAKINNTDISLALEDLKTFLTKELIIGLMENIIKISNNTGTTANNTGYDGTLGKLVDSLKPASQPYVRGRVEDAMTVTS